MADYQISEVAERTGFSPSTLRYYETIGIVAPTRRNAVGYRFYDDRAVARLTFIGRAKQLGCSLEETAQLLSAWDADCDGVRGQLRDLVATKISSANRQVADLVAFISQLQHVGLSLEGATSDGPCGDDCACLVEPAPDVVPVSFGTPDAAIACTLSSADDVRRRVADWQGLLSHVESRTAIDGGLRLQMSVGAPTAEILRMAEAEHRCCAFFAFSITIDDRGLALEVRAPEGARDLLAGVFGVDGAEPEAACLGRRDPRRTLVDGPSPILRQGKGQQMLG